jgi:DNA-binding NtrC family response regulator
MTTKKIAEIAEQFEALTIKNQMRILAGKAVNSRYLFYKEITEEFEKTLMQALLEKYDYNVLKMSLSIKLHRNSIAKKMKKMKLKDKKVKIK